MSGADAVVSVVLFEWAAGVVAAASWTQSWAVVRRGHFRIVAWAGVVLGGLAALASGADVPLVAAVFLALVVAYKPWALARLTTLSLIGTAASGMAGAAGAVLLMGASTEGAAFGFGAGEELAPAFFFVWLLLVAFTGVVVWMAHRCTRIRSIQSATGLMYVAILTAGVAEFLVRYLMVHAA